MQHRYLTVLLAAAAMVWSVAIQADTALKYPPAPRGSTIDDYHGIKVADPYRGLENLDAPDTRLSYVPDGEGATSSAVGALARGTSAGLARFRLRHVERRLRDLLTRVDGEMRCHARMIPSHSNNANLTTAAPVEIKMAISRMDDTMPSNLLSSGSFSGESRQGPALLMSGSFIVSRRSLASSSSSGVISCNSKRRWTARRGSRRR
jgi:hypothetical protein